MRLLLAGLGLGVLLAVVGCQPKNVAEAEEKGDVAWLDANGTPEAVAALGRLADTNTKAIDLLTARSTSDVNAYIAAWNGAARNAGWGAALLRAGLGDALRAETAASVMTRKDPRLAVFVPDLDASLVRIAPTTSGNAVASVLASVGPAATAAVQKRLEDKTTRGSMCRGIGSPDASVDAQHAILNVPPSSRDHASCIEAVLKMANDDAAALDWLATKAEPGLLSAAGRNQELPCAKLKTVWTAALGARPPQTYATLTVPLGNALKRCALQMDPVLADAIARLPPTHALIVQAVDPYGGEMADLKTACGALRGVANNTHDTAIVRARAADAVTHGCAPVR